MNDPKVIVFDLDYTLWPFWVDSHVTPPFSHNGVNIVDRNKEVITCFPDVPNILKKLHDDGFKIGIASRTSEIRGANQLIELFKWSPYISYKEIYPGSKDAHFKKIQEASGHDYNEMIFFDDEHRNIYTVSKLGVTCVLVSDGVTNQVLKQGFKQHQEAHSNT